ncbi:MAG: hypothetical protein AB3N20_12365 [Rhizobiaceae bacterium]
MKFVLANLAAIAIGAMLVSPALAAKCDSQGSKHSGIYELQDVMEVGSLIWLSKDGRFQYMLAYGAVDEVAEGCWEKIDNKVVLTPTKMQVSYGGRKFRRLELTVKSRGKLIRDFGRGHKGTYKRVRR